jgi:hypothetical protein
MNSTITSLVQEYQNNQDKRKAAHQSIKSQKQEVCDKIYQDLRTELPGLADKALGLTIRNGVEIQINAHTHHTSRIWFNEGEIRYDLNAPYNEPVVELQLAIWKSLLNREDELVNIAVDYIKINHLSNYEWELFETIKGEFQNAILDTLIKVGSISFGETVWSVTPADRGRYNLTIKVGDRIKTEKKYYPNKIKDELRGWADYLTTQEVKKTLDKSLAV